MIVWSEAVKWSAHADARVCVCARVRLNSKGSCPRSGETEDLPGGGLFVPVGSGVFWLVSSNGSSPRSCKSEARPEGGMLILGCPEAEMF